MKCRLCKPEVTGRLLDKSLLRDQGADGFDVCLLDRFRNHLNHVLMFEDLLAVGYTVGTG